MITKADERKRHLATVRSQQAVGREYRSIRKALREKKFIEAARLMRRYGIALPPAAAEALRRDEKNA